MKKTLNVGLIGYKFMGNAHSHALKSMHMLAGDLPVIPHMKVICGRDEAGVRQAADKYGWESWETSWRKVVEDSQVDVVDISSPGASHKEIAIAAAQSGKHIICEKPLANTYREAKEMVEVADKHGIKHVVNFNYRRVPAVALAKHLIESGFIGKLYSFQGVYQQDWPLDPDFPHVWRFDRKLAGAGSMADKGSHVIDLARYLVGDIAEVAGTMETFVSTRPDGQGGRSEVSTDDATVFAARFENGAIGSFHTNRMAAGHRNGLWFEVNGSKGSLRFELMHMNDLWVYSAEDDAAVQGFRKVSVTESSHPYIKYWWPPGHSIGWEHTFIHQYYELFRAIAANQPASPSFHDGMKCQQVIEAVGLSARESRWVQVNSIL